MKRLVNPQAAVWTVGIVIWLAGCDSRTSGPAVSKTASTETSAKASDAKEAISGKFQEVLAKLPPEDISKATAQKICPISEEPLGSMGVPPKVDVNGQSVWICCESCRTKLLADPEKHLARIKMK